MSQQVKTITSEALEAAYRALTPSQDGFTEDLMASNTIIPVLDLTASAEGTTTPQILQTALAHGSQTAFNVTSGTTTIINQPGFWQIDGQANLDLNNVNAVFCAIFINDGVSDKQIYGLSKNTATSFSEYFGETFNLIVFLRSGDSVKVQVGTGGQGIGSYRQIADVNGNLVYPSGFTPQ